MMIPVVLALFHLLVLSNGQSVIGTRFVKEPMLRDVTSRLAKGCSEEVAKDGISRIECVALCGRQDSCLGASLDDQGKCFLHRECLELGNEFNSVEEVTRSHRYLAKYCGLGTWDDNTQSCKCVRGMHGVRCDKYPKDCLALSQYQTGDHKVVLDPHQNGRNLYVLTCQVFSTTSVYHKVAISHGLKSFNRTWTEYVNGFYTDDTYMWAGLELWHLLCKDGCQRLTFFWSFESEDVTYRPFFDFFVSDASSYYAVNYDSTILIPGFHAPPGATFPDCFASLKGKPFSTWDQDNDGNDGKNCAAIAGSGWWYNGGDCTNPCHMLGLGFEYWNTSTPREQLQSFQGVDMDTLISKVVKVWIEIKK